MKWLVALSGVVALTALGGMWRLAGPEPQYVSSNGVRIAYTVEGQGDAIVLIHGLGSSADINWRMPGIIKSLSQKHRVIALDVRGHGRSDKPADEAEYGVEMVEDVVRLLNHLKISKAQVAGYSMGGMIAMKLTVRHPDRVSALALCGMGWLRAGSPLQSFWRNLGGRSRSTGAGACAPSFAALAVTAQEVKSIQCPTALFVGDRDPVKPLYVDPVRRTRPDWPMTTITDAGHLICVVKPEFRDSLTKWVAQNSIKHGKP